jgi:hypothetical protein
MNGSIELFLEFAIRRHVRKRHAAGIEGRARVVADGAAAESEDSRIENTESGSVPTVGGSENTQLPDTALRGSQQRAGGACAIFS